MLRWLALPIAVWLTGCAASSDTSSLPYTSAALDGARLPQRPMPAQLSIPDGPGPFPVIILLHACADPVGGEMHEWVERMKS